MVQSRSGVKPISKKMDPKEHVRKVPGSFVGWISARHEIGWVVSKMRRDKRTGATSVRPLSSYARELFESVSMKIPQRQEKAAPVELEQPPKAPVRLPTYTLNFINRISRNSRKPVTTTFQAASDTEAIAKATAVLDDFKINPYLREQAELF